jgi:hypothetical protein
MRLGAAFEHEHVAPEPEPEPCLCRAARPRTPHLAVRAGTLLPRSPALHAPSESASRPTLPHAPGGFLSSCPTTVAPFNPVLQQELIRVSVVLSPSTSFALPGTAFPPVCLRKTPAAS